MVWPAIPRNEDKGVVRYVQESIAQRFPIAIPRQNTLAQADGRRRVAAAIYDALAQRGIEYALEPYDADPRVQQIRPPDAILGGAREGTCLDLALLFAGIALGKDLAPLLVMLEGHALIAVSLDDGRRTASDLPRRNREGEWLDEGILRDGGLLCGLIDDGRYIAIECTGFASSSVLPPAVPEAANRSAGRLTFDAAVIAGRAQLDFVARPFRFAVDVAVLRDRDAFERFEPPFATRTSPYQIRLDRLMDDERLFGGRDDELRWLDEVIVGETGGYAFVTGKSGSGKTALLVNWVRRLLSRQFGSGQRLRLAYVFISQKYELADEQSTLELLCQQLLLARGRQEPLPNGVAALQEKYIELLSDPAPAGERFVVVIDGLDEAVNWTMLRLLFPHSLQHGVHMVFSAREVADVDWPNLLDLGSDVRQRSLAPLTVAAVASLIRAVPGLAAHAADAAFVAALHRVSAGDPFYLKFLVDDLVALPAPTVADVNAKPAGLRNYLDNWWDDVAKRSKNERSVRDLLSYLVVALGAIGRDELIEIDANDAVDSFTIDDAVTSVQRYVIGSETAGYALCHPRFREYLVADRIRRGDQRPYLERLNTWCVTAWQDETFHYPLAHVVGHLAGRREAALGTDRAAFTAQMLALLQEPGFRARKLTQPAGLIDYEDDCQTVLRAAMSDLMPDAIPAIASAALAISESRRVAIAVTKIFEAAAAGTPDHAASQLPIIAPDPDWLCAGLLVAAWLCARRDRDKARTYRAAQADTLQPDKLSGTLQLLDGRARAAIDGTPEPLLVPPYLPEGIPTGVSPETARAIVARIGGASDAETIAVHLNPSMIRGIAGYAGLGDETPQYIAEGDSPWLVGYAIANPGEGEALIRRYIAAHAENPYGVYRNRSLWGVLGAVLCHPNAAQACDLALSICEAAFNPVTVEYREMLGLAGMAVAAQLGEESAAAELEEHVRTASAAVEDLHPIRHEADTWGHHARRFAALAEVIALTTTDAGTAARLLDTAIGFPFGYAGYQSPASLALADANVVCRLTDVLAVDAALNAARRAAHNVQEWRFCALTTARVNAIVKRWRPDTLLELPATVARFTANPHAAEFAPTHLVGEQYTDRAKGPNMLPIPFESLNARSLAEIAQFVCGVPIASLERLNPGIDPAMPLMRDCEVNVLDSGFAPILAARFAAEALARRAELGEGTVPLITQLVPIAASSATALDLVLARLLLAARVNDLGLVKRVRDCAPSEWMVTPVPNPNIQG